MKRFNVHTPQMRINHISSQTVMNRVPFGKLPLISKIETREKVRTLTDVGRYIRVQRDAIFESEE